MVDRSGDGQLGGDIPVMLIDCGVPGLNIRIALFHDHGPLAHQGNDRLGEVRYGTGILSVRQPFHLFTGEDEGIEGNVIKLGIEIGGGEIW